MVLRPPASLSDRVRSGMDRVRLRRGQGLAALRIMNRAGVLRSIRPQHLARMALSARGSLVGPHLAVMLHAQMRPDHPAVIDPHRRLSYAELEQEVNQLCHALVARGVGPGDRVALMLPNCAEFIVALEALPRIGATAVQIGARLKAGEVGYILDNSHPRAMIYHASMADVVAEARRQTGGLEPEQLLVVGTEAGTGAAAVAGQPYAGALRDQPGDRPPPVRRRARRNGHGTGAEATEEIDSGVIVYTSGTTGKPKGASRSFSQTGLDAVAEMVERIGISNQDRHLVVCPLYHSAAPAFAIILLSLGATVVVADHFEAEAVLALIARERITSAFMVPTQLVRLTAVEPAVRARHDTSSLRWILSGAAQLTTETARRFQETYGPIVWNFYGATETGLVTLAGPSDHTSRPGTVGRLLPGNRIRILGEDKREVAPGEVGELYVQNATLISGYHGDPGATDSAMQGGFFSVGDLARVDADGYIYLASRIHDMVISGGVNIYPAEIEEHLHRHPDVLEAAVVGVPDDEWGERLKAFVVKRPGSALSAEDVIGFCREGLADFKRPREVEFLEALPRNPTGKVLKRELRAR